MCKRRKVGNQGFTILMNMFYVTSSKNFSRQKFYMVLLELIYNRENLSTSVRDTSKGSRSELTSCDLRLAHS